MYMMKKVSDMLSLGADTALGIVKVALQSRRASIRRAARPSHSRIIVLGNGPSLNTTIEHHLHTLKSTPCMAVNFFANTPVFREIRPMYYILVDPLFFTTGAGANFDKLHSSLAAVDWDMTLIVPTDRLKDISPEVKANSHITVVTINAVGVEGFRWFTDLIYSKAMGMPRRAMC